nr:MAG TPA: hypothetical protein [Microviridae sp.]
MSRTFSPSKVHKNSVFRINIFFRLIVDIMLNLWYSKYAR